MQLFSSSNKVPMKKKFNVKFFALLVSATALLAAGVHYLHAFQVKRNAKTLLEQARSIYSDEPSLGQTSKDFSGDEELSQGEEKHKAEGDRDHQAKRNHRLHQASELYSAFLRYYPDDVAALFEYGLLLDQLSARNPKMRSRAYTTLDKALRLNRDEEVKVGGQDVKVAELRRRAVKVGMSLGLFSEAKDHLQTLMKTMPDNGGLEHLLGQCEEANGDYEGAKRDYENAKSHAPGQIGTYLLLALLERRRLDQKGEADHTIEQAVENNPKSFEAYLAQFTYHREFKEREKADAAIAQAMELAPHKDAVILAAADWEITRAMGVDPHLNKAHWLLEDGIQLYPKNPAMYLLLAKVRELSGEHSEAINALQKGLQNSPDNPDIAWTLAELLIAKGESADVELDLLRRLRVSQSNLDFLQARLQIQQNKWHEAIRILESIRPELAKQPQMSFQADLLLGEAYRQAGGADHQYADQQYSAFRRAFEADSESVAAFLGMGSALLTQERFDQVWDLYHKDLPIRFLEDHDFLQALKQARVVASKDRSSFSDHLQLGHLLLAASRSQRLNDAQRGNLIQDAEKAFRQATAQSGGAPEPWIELVTFLVKFKRERKKEAQDALADMKGKMAPQYELLVRAHYCELTESKEAQSLYEQAAEMNKNDPLTQYALAGHYLRTQQFPKVGDFLTRITGEKPKDLRMRVAILLTQPGSQQRYKAISELEKLMPLGATPDEELLLAQLYERGDQSKGAGWQKSRQQFTDLLARNGDKAKHLAAYALALCRHGEWDECQTCLDKLEQLSEAAEPFVLTEVKAKLLASRHKPEQSISRIQDYVNAKVVKPEERLRRLEFGANLAESLSRDYSDEKSYATQAEKCYRELVAREPGKKLLLASFLSRQGRLAEALDWCEQAWTTCAPVEVAITALNAFRQKPGIPEQMKRLEYSINRAIDSNPKVSISLRACLANLHDFQGRYAEAIDLYRKVLTQDPYNPMALNNLAWLLALKEGKTADALGLINQAIEKMGPGPSLLDTRGVIYLTMGKPDRALEDLIQANGDLPSPANCFHLAEAYQVSKDSAAAKNAFVHGRQLGMKSDRLHPLERTEYARLAKELKVEPVE
jgi:tetratricopeptide (TPR) repeat protein